MSPQLTIPNCQSQVVGTGATGERFYIICCFRVSHSGQITVVATAVRRIRTKTNEAPLNRTYITSHRIPRGLEQGTKRHVEPRTRPVLFAMTQEQPWEWMKYSFAVDFKEPYFLSKRSSIFCIGQSMVGVSPHHKVDFEVTCHDTAAELSKQRETQFGLEGGFSCFSGSASMSFSKTASSAIRSTRVDYMVRASIATCHPRGPFEFNTHDFLDPTLVTLIRDEGFCPEETERKIGHFYVTKLTLGGVYQKSYVAHMSKGENKETIEAKVSAGFFSITGTSSLGSQSRTSKIDEKTWEKVSCQGGNAQIWLGATKENFEECQLRWAETVSLENRPMKFSSQKMEFTEWGLSTHLLFSISNC